MKLKDIHRLYLQLIHDVGGSFVPDDDADPGAFKLLHELVKAKMLRVEETDAYVFRYHLTALGREEVGPL